MFFLPLGGKGLPLIGHFWAVLWREEGFEPPTPWLVAMCSNPLSYRPHSFSTGSVPGRSPLVIVTAVEFNHQGSGGLGGSSTHLDTEYQTMKVERT
ncbi:hypothetical protein Tco_0530320 [Tanacetum coccineum]